MSISALHSAYPIASQGRSPASLSTWWPAGCDGHWCLWGGDGKVKMSSYSSLECSCKKSLCCLPLHLFLKLTSHSCCSNYNMRGRAEEFLVEGASLRIVAKREEYVDIMARWRTLCGLFTLFCSCFLCTVYIFLLVQFMFLHSSFYILSAVFSG